MEKSLFNFFNFWTDYEEVLKKLFYCLSISCKKLLLPAAEKLEQKNT